MIEKNSNKNIEAANHNDLLLYYPNKFRLNLSENPNLITASLHLHNA